MAVAFDGTRVIDAESATDWGGTASGINIEPDYKYQNTYCISGLVKTSEVNIYYTRPSGSDDYSTTPSVWLAKIIQTNKDALDGNGNSLRIGSSASDYYYYTSVFTAATYPIAGGWQIVPIDPNVAGYRSGSSGSPNLAAVTHYLISGDCSATAKAANMGMDAIDLIPSGKGLTWTGASGDFQDFVDYDEGTVTNRYGVVSTRSGIIYVIGTLTIGSATATTFTDSDKVLVFPDGRFNTGFAGLAVDLQNASTAVAITSCVFNGRGSYGADGGTADTRPNLTVTGTSGTFALTGGSLNNFNAITLTSGCTLDTVTLNQPESITQAGATITDCVVNAPPIATGAAAVLSDDPELISGCAFTSSGSGHAIRVRPTGAGPFEFDMDGNTFSGYAATDGSTGDETLLIDPVTTTANITINVTNGTTPTIMLAAGYTGTFTLVVNPVTTTITVKDLATQLAVGSGVARVLVVPSNATGDLLFEESVSLSYAGTGPYTVTVTHTGHGLSTGDYVEIRDTTYPQYDGVWQITVTGANSYTYSIPSQPGGTDSGTATEVLIIDTTDVNGQVSDTRTFSVDQPITGWARGVNATAPYYKEGPISGTVDKDTGVDITVFLARD